MLLSELRVRLSLRDLQGGIMMGITHESPFLYLGFSLYESGGWILFYNNKANETWALSLPDDMVGGLRTCDPVDPCCML